MKYNYARLQQEQETKQLRIKWFFSGLVIASILVILLLILFIQKQRIKVKNARLHQKILDDQLKTRNRELASHVLNMVRVNERKLSLIETLKEQLPNVKKENQQIMQKVIEGFEIDQDATIWKEFEIRFTEVHREFYSKLSKLNPNLTVNEKRLCAFLLLDMTTKEICSITGQSNRAIELARIRLRKQLGLTNQNVSLSNFLSSL
jgi:predicted Holliday junction resolvase-like endonuclease